jgi:hypothetical protein
MILLFHKIFKGKLLERVGHKAVSLNFLESEEDGCLVAVNHPV